MAMHLRNCMFRHKLAAFDPLRRLKRDVQRVTFPKYLRPLLNCSLERLISDRDIESSRTESTRIY